MIPFAAFVDSCICHTDSGLVGGQIVYLTVGKDTYQMEVPDRFLDKVPADFEVRSSRKVCPIQPNANGLFTLQVIFSL